MSSFRYTTLKGAKMYYRSLAKDFMMEKWVFDRIDECETISEVEHLWWGALKTI